MATASTRPELSASQELSRKLSLGEARSLEQASFNVVPQIFEGLASWNRPVLLEVACSADSVLAATVQSLASNTAAAGRCAPWNKCDLDTSEGVRLIVQRLQMERPRHVWMSPPSKAFSPMQNANRGSEAQREEQKQRRQQEIRVFLGAIAVFHACVQLGIHVTWEWPEHSNAWRLPVMQRLVQKYNLQVVTCKGCRVNARHSKSQLLLQKGWKLATTCARMAEVMQLSCRCGRDYVHGRCEGWETSRTRDYTPEFAKRVAQVMLQELNHQQVQWECQGQTSLPEGFGEGFLCQCKETHVAAQSMTCGACSVQGSWDQEHRPGDFHQVPQDGEASGFLRNGRFASDNGISPEEVEAFMSESEKQVCEAEAQRLLQNKDFRHESCEQLLKNFPLQPIMKHRRMLGNNRSIYVTLGVYAYGNHYGITKKTRVWENLCRYMNAYVENWSGPGCRTSLTISLNNQIPLHKDVNNDERFDNVLIGLGDSAREDCGLRM